MFCDCSAVKDKEKMCVRRKRGPPGRFRNAANMRALRVCGGPHLNKEDVQGYIKCGRKEKRGKKLTEKAWASGHRNIAMEVEKRLIIRA
jgi:hypothetical protein